MKVNRVHVICGLIAGILIRIAFYNIPLLTRMLYIVWAIVLLAFPVFVDKKLKRWRAERKREWWEKEDWKKEEEKWK